MSNNKLCFRSLLVFVIALLVSSFAEPALAQSRRASIGKVDAYVYEIDQFIKRNKKTRQILGDVAPYDSDKPQWKRFKSQSEADKVDELYESAYVWSRSGKVVVADFSITSPSGDWVQMIKYYFRADGSLAKIDSRLNTFYGDVSVLKRSYFNERGVVIHTTKQILDLKTQKPTKPKDDYYDREIPIYRKVDDLPFHKLL